MKTTSPAMKSRCVPKQVGRAAAEQQEAAEDERVGVDDPLQAASARSARPRSIVGSATFTIVASRMTMNCATQTRPRTSPAVRCGKTHRAGSSFGSVWLPNLAENGLPAPLIPRVARAAARCGRSSPARRRSRRRSCRRARRRSPSRSRGRARCPGSRASVAACVRKKRSKSCSCSSCGDAHAGVGDLDRRRRRRRGASAHVDACRPPA